MKLKFYVQQQVDFKPSQAMPSQAKPSQVQVQAASLFVELVQRKPNAAEVGVVPGALLLELELQLDVATARMQFGIIERQVRKVASGIKQKKQQQEIKT